MEEYICNIKKAYSEYKNCIDIYSPKNKKCIEYSNAYKKLIEPYIKKRINPIVTSKDDFIDLDYYLWEL